MNTSRQIYESDDEGRIHVDLAVGEPHRKIEVVVVWSDVEGEESSERVDDLIGILAGVDLERPPQGSYERRDPLG